MGLILLLLACRVEGEDSQKPQPEGAGAEGGGEEGDGSGAGDSAEPESPVVWTPTRVWSGEVLGLSGLEEAFVSRSNDYLYMLEEGGAGLRYLTNAYVQPEGEYCLNHTSDWCETNGPDWLSGQILPTRAALSMCQEPQSGQLYLIGGANPLEIADLAPEGETAYSYNRASSTLRLPAGVADPGLWTGPCLATEELLLLSNPAGGLMAVPLDGGEVLEQATEGAEQPVGQWGELLLLVDADSGSVRLREAADLSLVQSLELGVAVVDMAWDGVQGALWLATAAEGGGVLVSAVDGELVASSLALSGALEEVVADERRGQSWWLARRGDGSEVLHLVSPTGLLLATSPLEGAAVGLARPSHNSDLVVFLEGSGADLRYEVWEAAPDRPEPELPPLQLFLAANIEEPADDDLDKPCTSEEAGVDSMEAQLARIEANAEVLAGMGVPVALGITWNFVDAVERCGRSDIFTTLQSHGFVLGSMVHNKPCYSCSDSGEGGMDWCEANDPDYCGAGEDCCLPADPEYCERGDHSCYQSFVDERNLRVDGAIPGGGAFIIGADRHGMWDWDWVSGYEQMARADGSRGYAVSYFSHSWAYSTEVSFNDPRGKNPGPWRPEDAVLAWTLGDYRWWAEESAFGSVRYLPGVNTATVKLSEWHRSGLWLLDTFEEDPTFDWDEQDFQILSQLLRHARDHRSPQGVNTFYFHIHDLSLYSTLVTPDGVETEGAGWLRDWLGAVQRDFVEPGHAAWATPDQIATLE